MDGSDRTPEPETGNGKPETTPGDLAPESNDATLARSPDRRVTGSKPRRRFLPRFSLRTLLLFVLLCGSGFGLWWRWEPEVRASPLAQGTKAPVCEYWVSPDGKYVGAGAQDGSVIIWNMSTDEKVSEIKGHLDRISDICFSPDSKVMATCSWRDSGKLWTCKTGKILMELQNHDGQKFRSSFGVNFSIDSHLVVVGTSSGMEVWDIRTGQWAFKVPDKWNVNTGAFTDDEAMLLTGTGCYEIPTGKAVERPAESDGVFRANRRRSPNDESFYVGRVHSSLQLCVYRKRSADWTPMQMPEFWLSLLFGFGLLWSLVRDFRTLRKKSAEGAP